MLGSMAADAASGKKAAAKRRRAPAARSKKKPVEEESEESASSSSEDDISHLDGSDSSSDDGGRPRLTRLKRKTGGKAAEARAKPRAKKGAANEDSTHQGLLDQEPSALATQASHRQPSGQGGLPNQAAAALSSEGHGFKAPSAAFAAPNYSGISGAPSAAPGAMERTEAFKVAPKTTQFLMSLFQDSDDDDDAAASAVGPGQGAGFTAAAASVPQPTPPFGDPQSGQTGLQASAPASGSQPLPFNEWPWSVPQSQLSVPPAAPRFDSQITQPAAPRFDFQVTQPAAGSATGSEPPVAKVSLLERMKGLGYRPR